VERQRLWERQRLGKRQRFGERQRLWERQRKYAILSNDLRNEATICGNMQSHATICLPVKKPINCQDDGDILGRQAHGIQDHYHGDKTGLRNTCGSNTGCGGCNGDGNDLPNAHRHVPHLGMKSCVLIWRNHATFS
jgi:hypothetical protein